MKHRATLPNAYAHDESLGMRDSLRRLSLKWVRMHRNPRLTDPGAKSHCLHYSAGGATNGSIRGVKMEIPG